MGDGSERDVAYAAALRTAQALQKINDPRARRVLWDLHTWIVLRRGHRSDPDYEARLKRAHARAERILAFFQKKR